MFNTATALWLDTLASLGWRDAFRLHNAKERFYTWYSPNGGNGFRLDQAFVNPQLRPRLRDVRYDWGRRAGRPARQLSDHAALLVDLHS